MTHQLVRVEKNENPIYAIIRDGRFNFDNVKEIKFSGRVYNGMGESHGSRIVEVLPNCFAHPLEIWSYKTCTMQLVYMVEKLHANEFKVRMIQKTDFVNDKFEEYVYPQRECEEGIALIL